MSISKNPHRLLFLLCLILALSLSGCVRTTDGSFSSSADKDKAEAAYVRLGLAYLQEEQFDRSRQHLNRAMEINRRSAPAMAGLGLLNEAQGEMEIAERRFNEALSADRNYTRGRSYYGAFLYNEGRFEEAYEQLRRASEDTEFEGRPGIFINIGRTANRLGRYEDAAAAYQRSLRLERNNHAALEGAMVNLVEAGKFADARPLYERLVMSIRASENVNHSAASLWAGIRLADDRGDQDQVASLALLLRSRYPDSVEFEQYRAMRAND
ncbi:MAG: type IV pilus biogenesis/stability protein PilW [Halomonadaceae bacterium]|nr:MAG: type IV pilus biogenesis/stability protein PilW [Halomonadaceae bacterium]